MYKRQVKVSIECLTYSIISIIYIKKDSWLLKKKKKTVDVLVFDKTIQAWRQNLLNSSFLEKKLVFLVFSSSILEVLTSYFRYRLHTAFFTSTFSASFFFFCAWTVTSHGFTVHALFSTVHTLFSTVHILFTY